MLSGCPASTSRLPRIIANGTGSRGQLLWVFRNPCGEDGHLTTSATGAAGALTPYAGVALAADGARTWRLGTRLRLDSGLDSGLAVSLEGTRAEPVSATARHTLALAATLNW